MKTLNFDSNNHQAQSNMFSMSWEFFGTKNVSEIPIRSATTELFVVIWWGKRVRNVLDFGESHHHPCHLQVQSLFRGLMFSLTFGCPVAVSRLVCVFLSPHGTPELCHSGVAGCECRGSGCLPWASPLTLVDRAAGAHPQDQQDGRRRMNDVVVIWTYAGGCTDFMRYVKLWWSRGKCIARTSCVLVKRH